MAKHLKTCPERQKAMELANHKSGQEKNIFHLQAYDAYSTDFWLHLEVNSSATLADVDYII